MWSSQSDQFADRLEALSFTELAGFEGAESTLTENAASPFHAEPKQ